MSKKILFFIEGLWPGGKERRLVELLIYLKENTDYKIRLVLTENQIHYDYILKYNIQIDVIKRFYFKKDPSLFLRFLKIAKEFKPDIIHSWGFMTTFYAIPTKIILNKPMLGNLIAYAKNNDKKFSFSNFIQQVAFKFSDVILGNSIAGFKEFGIDKNIKTRLIYNGVRLERFDIQIDEERIKVNLNIHTTYILIMVAAIRKSKDYDLLLDVAKELAKYRNDITILGVGGGDELGRLEKRINDEGIANVRLMGKQNSVEQLIKISDIGLLFSYSEGISNAIIEYMALNKPVITTDTYGGSCEIIEQGKSGYIIEKNVNVLTDKIIELLENKYLRIQLGNRGREIIEEKFSINKMGQSYVELYSKY